MRVLGTKENKLILQDNLSGSEITLFYRMPTTQEVNAYANGMVTRKGNKLQRTLGEMRQLHGTKILTGVGEGSFGRMVEGKVVPLSSNPASANFDQDWKRQVAEQAPDIVEALAIHVFEVSVQVSEANATGAAEETEDAEGK
jgi:hypothetical protein